MPINVDIQNKVLKIAANKAIDNNTRLAVRKQFYVLKSEEIDLEAVQEEFNQKIAKFGTALNGILTAAGSAPIIETIDVPNEEIIEEIIIPKKEPTLPGGVKVRMQEELETSADDGTDFEVPFEVDEN